MNRPRLSAQPPGRHHERDRHRTADPHTDKWKANMITCCIQYTLDPHELAAFEQYAACWPPIIERCGGALVGYFLPKEGANTFALALIDFDSLADYEIYRQRLLDDPDARANVTHARTSRCIRVESRSFLRRG